MLKSELIKILQEIEEDSEVVINNGDALYYIEDVYDCFYYDENGVLYPSEIIRINAPNNSDFKKCVLLLCDIKE